MREAEGVREVDGEKRGAREREKEEKRGGRRRGKIGAGLAP